ncbi:MAG: PfkB family carbohydrate kinase [Microvirga sp.]
MIPSRAPVVVVVGSLHYDIMIDAPDRPRKGETVAGHAWRPKFGGKGGNQAIAAAEAGARVRMAGAVGADDFGRFLLDRLDRTGVDHSRVVELPGIGSGMSVAISDAGGDYGAVIVSGSNLHIDEAGLADPGLWAEARALILQNEVPDRDNLAAARAAKAAGAGVFLNAAPARTLPADLAGLVDVLIVNAIEAEDLCGIPVRDLASAADAAQHLASRFASVVVTAGGDGVAGSEEGSLPIRIPARPVELVSTHGAGDVFVGRFVASRARGQGFADSIAAANDAAAAHVSARRDG